MFCSAWFSFLGLQLSDYGGSEKNSKARKKPNLISEKLVVIFKETQLIFYPCGQKACLFLLSGLKELWNLGMSICHDANAFP